MPKDDPISRQAALDELDARCESECEHSKKQRSIMCDACYLGSAKEVIEALPAIDAVPVVRCKDCEFYTEDERWCRRLGLVGAFDPNGYCSHAERSGDGET